MKLQDLLCAELKRQLAATGPLAVNLPAGGELLWRWFLDLHKARTFHAAGPNPITHADILAYASLTRWPIEPRHIAIIRAMDETYLEAVMQKRESGRDEARKLPLVSPVPISAGLLDAMFGGQ